MSEQIRPPLLVAAAGTPPTAAVPFTVPQSAASQMVVTVILSSYNYGRFLGQAIDSVLSQTHTHFELIVVDDGSTDHSREVLAAQTDARVAVLLQENRGQACAWNRAYARSTGELIFFLDSDDWWDPPKLATMVHAYAAAHRKPALMQHNLMAVRADSRAPYRRTLASGDCFAEMRATHQISFFVTSTGLCLPRWVCDKVFPVPEALRISPDAFVTRVAMACGDVLSLGEPLGYLRLHGDNAGMTQSQAFHDDLRVRLIFPALNQRYKELGIDHQYGQTPTRPPGLLRRAWRKLLR